MIHWAWLLFASSLSGLVGWLVCALCSAASIDPEPEEDESHSATRYGMRTTAPPQRIIPEAVKDHLRAEWAKPAEVEPCDDPLRGSF